MRPDQSRLLEALEDDRALPSFRCTISACDMRRITSEMCRRRERRPKREDALDQLWRRQEIIGVSHLSEAVPGQLALFEQARRFQ